MDSPRHRFVKGDIADAAVAAPLVRGPNIVVHFAAESHVDRSIQAAGDFIQTDVFGTFVLLEAARQAPALTPVRADFHGRGLRQRAGRATAAKPTSCGRATRTRPARPAPTGSPTATGPPTACRSSSPARRTTTARTSSRRRSSRSSSRTPIDSLPLPALWRRPERARLVARGRPLPRHRPADRARAERRGLQHRRRQRSPQRGPDAPHPGADRAARHAHQAGAGSPGPRPPLRAGHRQTARDGLGAPGRVRGRPGRHRRLVPRERVVVAADQGTGRRSTARSTTRSTPTVRPPDAACRTTRFWSRARPDLRAGTCSTGSPIARRSSPGIRPGGQPPDPQPPHRLAADRPARPRRRGTRHRGSGADPDLPCRGRARGRVVVRQRRAAPADQRARHPPPARGGSPVRARRAACWWSRRRRSTRSATTPSTRTPALVPATPYGLSKLAQDRLAERAWRDDDMDVVIARPFNHAGPRQTAAFVVSSFAGRSRGSSKAWPRRNSASATSTPGAT